jgi:hypothetical protein
VQSLSSCLDRHPCAAAGIPPDITFAIKPALAQAMLARAFAAQAPASWVTGDSVYGNDSQLRFWLHAGPHPYVLVGEYTDVDGQVRQVAISIGPEHGTVGPDQVKEAAKEAVQGVGFDVLVVCGFAFDPHVSEEVKRYGKLTVLPAKMNPDLAMGDELLKKTGAGNLFMVFGEPDIEIIRQIDGQIVVEIKGVDVYDPTTGNRQDRGQGHQPLRRRGAEGVCDRRHSAMKQAARGTRQIGRWRT